MSRSRPSGLALVATLFVVTGLALMLGSLQIESNRTSEPDAATAGGDIVVPTTAPIAATATSTAKVGPSDAKATRLFARAQQAGRTVAYGGVKEVSRWSADGKASKVVLRIQHVPGHGTVVARSAAGVATPAPTESTVAVEPAVEDESATLAALVRNYRLVAGPSEPMLGRQADLLEAHRADDSLAARFWIDQETGLVLRRELIGKDGTAETATYVTVTFDAPATPTSMPTPTDAWTVVDDAGVDALRAQGWTLPATLSDGMTLYQVRTQTSEAEPIVQLRYTDGLVAVSVFLQRGVLDRGAMAGYVPVTAGGGEVWVRTGNLFFTWQSRPAAAMAADGSSRDLVVSVLADSPNAPVGAVLGAFPPLPAEEAGVGDHVTRGVQRVGSWFDPLG